MLRIVVRVSADSGRPGVGGRYGDAEPPVLVVRVGAPAAAGKANKAVVRTVAEAFQVPPRSVRIVHGLRSRTKLLEVLGADAAVLAGLLTGRHQPSR